MHIHEVMAAADYRMVEGRDWLWDFLGRDCREIIFEQYGLHESDEHFPVSAVFHCATGTVRQLTVETENQVHRWIDPECEPGYVLACSDIGEKPFREPGVTWTRDAAEILGRIRPALHPERRPDDTDESYRWEGSELEMITENMPGDISINP